MKGGKIKIGDFGLSKKSSELTKMMKQTIVGTPLYMPLQVLKCQ
jgi:serine/threonine protein kinase